MLERISECLGKEVTAETIDEVKWVEVGKDGMKVKMKVSEL